MLVKRSRRAESALGVPYHSVDKRKLCVSTSALLDATRYDQPARGPGEALAQTRTARCHLSNLRLLLPVDRQIVQLIAALSPSDDSHLKIALTANGTVKHRLYRLYLWLYRIFMNEKQRK